MIFEEMKEKDGYIFIDGYSKNKTLKGAIKDLARSVAKYNEDEANVILDSGVTIVTPEYEIEILEVAQASRYIKGNVENGIESKMANYYCFIKYVA